MVVIQKPSTEVNNGAVLATDGVGLLNRLSESHVEQITGELSLIFQNYQVPNVTKLAGTALFLAKVVEEKYRKPKKRDDDDD
ncbi:hypothetical protein JHK85_022634 [Glycine max]|nr:hypothetical protein JHK85_022634 [Glycine max]